MQRKLNFNAGPATLPSEVLEEAAEAMREYHNTGISILELYHRGTEFMSLLEESKALVKELCVLGDDYEVLWLHGGGRQQFCMIPMNFLEQGDTAGYIDSGYWAEQATQYALYYGNVQVLSSSKATNYNMVPEFPQPIPAGLSYVHYTTNNTIYGTQLIPTPATGAPLIADMSSDILSCVRDYSNCSLFYATAQKNLGTAGIALVVIRRDFLQHTKRELPPMLSYKAHVAEKSVLNTANTSGIYIALLMLRWIKNKGIHALENENRTKAKLLYDALDSSRVFTPYVQEKAHRSIANVTFTALNRQYEQLFIERCRENNIAGIEGHRTVGGFRVSLYNAVPISWVEHLVDLMKDFETKL
jgi:phosphoserine aminotransferase